MEQRRDACRVTRKENRNPRARGTRQQLGGNRRLRGLTCANCRARKVRCEGGQPTCKTCDVYNDECRYDKVPSMAQVLDMARRLQEAEKLLAERLQGRDSSATSTGGAGVSFSLSPQPEPADVPDFLSRRLSATDASPRRQTHARLSVLPTPLTEVEHAEPSAVTPGSAHGALVILPEIRSASGASDDAATSDGPPLSAAISTTSLWTDLPTSLRDVEDPSNSRCGGSRSSMLMQHHRRHHDRPAPTPKDPPATELSVDEHGKICYYGPTSAVHDPPSQLPADSLSPQSTAATTSQAGRVSRLSSRDEMRVSLSSYVREMSTWEEFALGNASLQTGIPRKTLEKLLHLHWTWVSPMFMWVYRPAFVRDMATGGRYYSEFLLTVICGHAAKYQQDSCAEFLLARARRLLGTAIQQPSSIPTVQGLLQLSARDLAHGSISQAWVYSGIAFRMASDLGLQHSSDDVKGLSPVDLEIRRRLFWGCYFWDKATSLYAGRLPVVTEVLDPSSLDLLDDSADTDTWVPYHGDSLNLTISSMRGQYPPMKSHAVSCFVNSCRLSIIINDIVVQLYSKRNRSNTEAALNDIKLRLDIWRAGSPPHLKLNTDNLPAVCPPPHIVSQNLLYFASVILAHRPFWSIPAYYRDCIRASQSIEKLVLLLESTFGLENITYLMGYCIYTGASAILEEAKSGSDPAALATMQTFLRALNTGMPRCPLLERSLSIIVKGMNSASLSSSSPSASVPQQSPAAVAGTDHTRHSNAARAHQINGYIPAFPYVDSMASVDFNMDSYLGGGAMDPVGGLDCFPEMQIDLGPLV